jgi:DNA-binding response OmpR family regulator
MMRGGRPWPLRGPARVLLASRHQSALAFAAERLTSDPFACYTVRERTSAIAIASSWRPHLVLGDVELLDAGVLAALRPPARGGPGLPLVALVGTVDPRRRLGAFDAGADDVVEVPFSSDELLARVRALLRRAYAEAESFGRSLCIGGLELDATTRSARVDGADVDLTPLQFSFLYLLASRVGQIVTRDQILDALWGADHAPASNVVDSLVRTLRARLGDDFRRPRFIATLAGRGYCLIESAPIERLAVGADQPRLSTAS